MSLKNKKKNMKKGYAFLKTGNESAGNIITYGRPKVSINATFKASMLLV